MVRDLSINTYKQIISEGLLSKRREETYQALFKYGPCTANELFREWHGTTHITQQNIHPRLGELRERGVVAEVGEKKCRVTGRIAIVWDVTSRLPQEPEKIKKTKCKHCDGTGYIEDRQRELFS